MAEIPQSESAVFPIRKPRLPASWSLVFSLKQLWFCLRTCSAQSCFNLIIFDIWYLKTNYNVIFFSRITFFCFFQAEDGIRDAQESRGLGDVYKRQIQYNMVFLLELIFF